MCLPAATNRCARAVARLRRRDDPCKIGIRLGASAFRIDRSGDAGYGLDSTSGFPIAAGVDPRGFLQIREYVSANLIHTRVPFAKPVAVTGQTEG